MARRDWYGTGLVAVLIALVIILFKTWAAPVLGAVAFILVVLIVRDVRHPKKPTIPVSISTMYEEGSVTSVSAYNAAGELTGIKRLGIQKARLRPDFAPEWAERDRLMALCSGTNEESEAVEAWTKTVYTKLRSWKPSKALEFRPDESSVTKYPEHAHMMLPPAVKSMLQGFDTNRSRQQLTMYGERLAKILDVDED